MCLCFPLVLNQNQVSDSFIRREGLTVGKTCGSCASELVLSESKFASLWVLVVIHPAPCFCLPTCLGIRQALRNHVHRHKYVRRNSHLSLFRDPGMLSSSVRLFATLITLFNKFFNNLPQCSSFC